MLCQKMTPLLFKQDHFYACNVANLKKMLEVKYSCYKLAYQLSNTPAIQSKK